MKRKMRSIFRQNMFFLNLISTFFILSKRSWGFFIVNVGNSDIECVISCQELTRQSLFKYSPLQCPGTNS